VPWSRADAGIMITASHNEPPFNGWKFIRPDGSVLHAEDMATVQRRVRASGALPDRPDRRFAVRSWAATSRRRYLEFLIGLIGPAHVRQIRRAQLRIAVDPNGGAAIVFLRPLLRALGVHALEKGMAPGRFSRTVEPNAAALSSLTTIVRNRRAVFGIGFDADADRAGVVVSTDRGTAMLDGNTLLALLIASRLHRSPKPHPIVVLSDATSDRVRQIARAVGARVVDVGVGESNVLRAMDRWQSPIGGEGTSGGAVIPPGRSRDGLAMLVLLLALVARSDQSLGAIAQALPSRATLQTKVRIPPERITAVQQQLRSLLRHARTRTAGGTTGGIKVLTPGGWYWFRASRTEAGVYRIIADAPTATGARRLMATARRLFAQARYS
ncbi:MAG: hypothetical protein HY341_01370, partial [Candidatus Kerfeldbacteria bacterium]|nr:hypothetical protein [Candidatus Kerfeldbacteria bacterium]